MELPFVFVVRDKRKMKVDRLANKSKTGQHTLKHGLNMQIFKSVKTDAQSSTTSNNMNIASP